MITIVKVQHGDYSEALAKSVEALEGGEVVVIPTDTAYGLAARADNEVALKKIIDIKRRSPDKGLSMIVKDVKHAGAYATVDARVKKFFETLMPGPLTFLLPSGKHASGLLTGRFPTVAVRVPDHPFTKMLSEAVSFAYTSTSANTSGSPCETDPHAIIAQLAGGSVQPNLVIDDGAFSQEAYSTILDLTCEPYAITRVGVVSPDELTLKLQGLA